jgi:hypothetical protein
LGEWKESINNVFTLSNEKMKETWEINLDSTIIPRALAPKPRLRGKFGDKDWVTYQRRGKKVQQEPQSSEIQQPQSAPIQQSQNAPSSKPQLNPQNNNQFNQ